MKVLEKLSVSLCNGLEEWLISLRNGIEKCFFSLRNDLEKWLFSLCIKAKYEINSITATDYSFLNAVTANLKAKGVEI